MTEIMKSVAREGSGMRSERVIVLRSVPTPRSLVKLQKIKSLYKMLRMRRKFTIFLEVTGFATSLLLSR